MCNELRQLLEQEKVKDDKKVEPRKCTNFETFHLAYIRQGPIHTSNFILMKLGVQADTIHENLKLLAKIDPLRKNYYEDFGKSVSATAKAQ